MRCINNSLLCVYPPPGAKQCVSSLGIEYDWLLTLFQIETFRRLYNL